MAIERKNVVTSRGNPITLLGEEIKPGQKAPDFSGVGQGMSPVSLKDFEGKIKVILTVPSLDTAVCSTETQKFSEMAKSLPEDVQIVVASMDLPFAQSRWCGAQGVENVVTVSDFRDRDIGEKFGVRVKESGLLTRAVFVVDKANTVRYVEYVPETSNEPNYDAAREAIEQALS
ncbi:MAG TPA: thiol peroxidase [Dehalococcoidia bacterium]|nr:thiol peroxidase [Dehalococcoidia bacterium]